MINYFLFVQVRFNLDPFNEHLDEEVWEVLENVNMKEHILSLPGKLEDTGYAHLAPDMDHVVFQATEKGIPGWYLLDHRGPSPRCLTQPGFGIASAGLVNVAPDGAKLIVRKNDTWAIQDSAGGEPKPIPGMNSNERPIGWCQELKGVYVRTLTLPVELNRVDLATGTRHPVFTFRPTDPSGLLLIRNIYTTVDARIFALSYVRELSNLYLAEGLH